MRYTVTIGKHTLEVDVRGNRVQVAGRELTAHLVVLARTPVTQLVLDGMAHRYAMERGPDGWTLHSRGEARLVEVMDERTRQVRDLAGRRAGRQADGVIRAPMPGLVLRVEVAVGDVVGAGRGLVVLEAMKMENEITAPAPGVVRAVAVVAGQVVEKGAWLVELAAEGHAPQA